MTLIVMHFRAGAIALGREGDFATAPSVNIPRELIVSANGAGDAFAAGLLYGIHEGWRVPAALELAHATEAMSLMGLSTCAAVQSHEACLGQARIWGLPFKI